MKPFEHALDTTHSALAGLRETAAIPPRASRASLERLIEASRADQSSSRRVSTPAPERVAKAAATSGGLGLAARARAAIEAAAPTPQVAPAKPQLPAVAIQPSDDAPRKAEQLEALRQQFVECAKCGHLVASRSNIVFGVGNPDAELMFVGEAPGADEDLQGEPFVGKAGQLLTKIIEAMGFQRSDVYIANVLKCRPDMPPGATGNRKPRPDEMATCLPYLIRQIEIIQPKCLVALGSTAVEGLLGEPVVMREVRGRWHSFEGIPLMATYHPAYLLRNQSLGEKRKVWEDMLQVMEKLAIPISPKQRGFFLQK